MPFGQVVVGPPGSGKTVYCAGMQQFLGAIGRKVAVVNLDPANDTLPYTASIDICSVITLEEIMDKTELGPNGALIYSMEFLEKNLDWLKKCIDNFPEHYFIFDCPGQVELYTHHNSMKNIVAKLQSSWNFRLTCLHLVDAVVCTQAPNYISAVLLSLSIMLQLELPHINVLSKIDLLKTYGKLDFNLEFYTEVFNLSYLQEVLDANTFSGQYKKLNQLLCELIEDFSLVSFYPLNIEDKESVYTVLKAVDKSNGFIYGGLTEGNESIMLVAEQEKRFLFPTSADIQEKYAPDNASLLGNVVEK